MPFLVPARARGKNAVTVVEAAMPRLEASKALFVGSVNHRVHREPSRGAHATMADDGCHGSTLLGGCLRTTCPDPCPGTPLLPWVLSVQHRPPTIARR